MDNLKEAIEAFEDYFNLNADGDTIYVGRRLTDMDYINAIDDICRKYNVRFEETSTNSFNYRVIKNSRQIKSGMEFDELTEFSHQIAKSVISEKMSLQQAVSEVMNELNCNEKYALTCVHNWIENEPTYNGMTMTSSRQIKSGLTIPAEEWAHRWIPNIMDQRNFISMCNEDGYTEFDSETFHKLLDKYNFKANGRNGYLGPVTEHQIKSARYIATDPESGEVLGSADTYEEAVNEWGEDVTITDSEAAEGQENMEDGLFSSFEEENEEDIEIESSKKPSGDKAFLSKIVSSFLKQDMTEEQALKRIMLRNNCNIGYAKQIFSNAIEDDSLIQSGVMDIADDINKDFNIDGDIESWYKDYVPENGVAHTIGGEILRAYSWLKHRYFNDGDKIGIGYGKETVNPAARYLVDKCVEMTEVGDIEDMLNGSSDINKDDDSYNEWLEDLEPAIEDYLRNHEELFHAVNKDDFVDYGTEEDEDSSVEECYIVDEEGNEYWFQGGPDGWACYTINYAREPKFKVDDWIDDLDVIPDTSQDFADFELDGFEYSAEKGSNGEDWMITDVRLPNELAHYGDEWETSDFENYTIYDPNGREISVNDLY